MGSHSRITRSERPRRRSYRNKIGFAVISLGIGGACVSGEPKPQPQNRAPLDRLAPQEVATGEDTVYGLVLPRDMSVEYRFRSGIHVVGKVPPGELAKYVGDRVTADRIEVNDRRTVFSNAQIKDGDPARRYEIEITPIRLATKMVVREQRRPPTISVGDTPDAAVVENAALLEAVRSGARQ